MEALHLMAQKGPRPWPVGLPAQEFRSEDLDDVRHHVGSMFCEHDMRMVDRRGRLNTDISRFQCRAVTFVDMAYGADVMINPGSLNHFYLIQIPLAGSARIVMNGEEFDCQPGMATVQDPDVPLQMYWRKGCRKLVLRFDRARFERFTEIHYGRTFPRALSMTPAFDLAHPAGVALAGLFHNMRFFGFRTGEEIPPAIQAHWAMCFMSALLMLRKRVAASMRSWSIEGRRMRCGG